MSSTFPAGSDGSEIRRAALAIDSLIRRDPGGRGLSRWAVTGDLLQAAVSLSSAKRVGITTGFYIRSCDTIETDGPPGAIGLCDALSQLRIAVELLVDEYAVTIFQCCSDVLVRGYGTDDHGALNDLGSDEYSHLVAVERPGRTAEGRYYSMRGEDISSHVAPMDLLFTTPLRSWQTIGIGDGGNEIGLAPVGPAVDRYLNSRFPISSCTPADFVIYAGVSNWGAYGLCAMMSIITGLDLLPRQARVREVFECLVDHGVVDGVTLKRNATVDGLPLDAELELLGALRNQLEDYWKNLR